MRLKADVSKASKEEKKAFGHKMNARQKELQEKQESELEKWTKNTQVCFKFQLHLTRTKKNRLLFKNLSPNDLFLREVIWFTLI